MEKKEREKPNDQFLTSAMRPTGVFGNDEIPAQTNDHRNLPTDTVIHDGK